MPHACLAFYLIFWQFTSNVKTNKLLMEAVKNVDTYIQQFPTPLQERLQQVREVITQTAPEANELISYGMPAYKLHGKPLVYFAGYKNHIGLYATPNGHAAFQKEFSKYKQGKGSVQFPLLEPLPLDLIQQVVAFRIKTIQEETPGRDPV
jgi:uncharacterized protein YdhG (YjbR/CyaY superfamily)